MAPWMRLCTCELRHRVVESVCANRRADNRQGSALDKVKNIAAHALEAASAIAPLAAPERLPAAPDAPQAVGWSAGGCADNHANLRLAQRARAADCYAAHHGVPSPERRRPSVISVSETTASTTERELHLGRFSDVRLHSFVPGRRRHPARQQADRELRSRR